MIVKHPPTCKMVSKSIHMLYTCVQEQFLHELKIHEGTIYLGVDAWQTPNGFDIIGVVIYRLLNDNDRKMKFKSSAMPLVLFSSNKATPICRIVSDNASNNWTMIEELEKLNWKRFKGELQWIWCFAHILNLIVKAILSPFGGQKTGASDVNESVEEEEAQELVDRFDNIDNADDSDDDADDSEDGSETEKDDGKLEGDDELTLEDLCQP
ncbi:hypothetical protein PSTG_00820 [Puccinia striiformis f. sp. tritici PST-78]|uniref:DUF659 domain-containing protein n=1 Tax=Puccinia striiformis f. sp. tritici PST-78 TaxID=1165861 RepID=A0A0L0W491_9BASI|nr:hypothetical protein PSTG_00820 [Puccinia striiformis f. sp. tritici PST-78]